MTRAAKTSRGRAAPGAPARGVDTPSRGESALIDAFLAPFGLSRGESSRARAAASPDDAAAQSGVLRGPGDDCAQLAPSRGMTLVATTDAAVDRIHFDLRRSSALDAGWKALAMNLSDLAAAAARPRWFLCALGVPELPTREALALARAFAEGMAPLAKQSGCALVGGNVTRAAEWSLTITALGEAKRPLSRAGGRPGDRLVLIGELGAAALGLRRVLARPARAANHYGSVASAEMGEEGALGRSGRGGEPAQRGRARAQRAGELALLCAQLRPAPQLAAGAIAARFASAAIDVSDGLLQDLGHLCARSGCAATLDCDALPRPAPVRAAEARDAEKDGAHPLALSLAGGEDYALLLAVPEQRTAPLLAALQKERLEGHVIGQLEPLRRGQLGGPHRRGPMAPAIALVQAGRALALPARLGHDHLK